MLQNILIWHQNKYFCTKLHEFKKIAVPLHPLTKKNASTTLHHRSEIRDVAQLVAHYVRDVGVGRSSRLIPTTQGCQSQELALQPLKTSWQ